MQSYQKGNRKITSDKNNLRLASGWAKGMAILTPQGLETRPTSAKARQALLNILQRDIVGARFVDLFAGSGAIGLEALSRGASLAAFVESSRNCAGILQKNLDELRRRATANKREIPKLTLLQKDVGKAWKDLEACGPFDIIWADPPYAEAAKWWSDFRENLSSISAQGAVFAAESDAEGAAALLKEFGESLDWQLNSQKTYGRTWITLFVKSG